MTVFSAARSRASHKYYEKGSLSACSHCFALSLARKASAWFAGQECGLSRPCGFNGDENKQLRSLPSPAVAGRRNQSCVFRDDISQGSCSEKTRPCFPSSSFSHPPSVPRNPWPTAEMLKAAGSPRPRCSGRPSLTPDKISTAHPAFTPSMALYYPAR